MISMFRSLGSLIVCALGACAFAVDVAKYCLSKFDIAVEAAVDLVVATAKAIQHDAISFVQKSSAGVVTGGGRSFSSMLRSLDASEV